MSATDCAASTKLTLLVGDLEGTGVGLTSCRLELGPASGGDFATVVQIEDLHGNIARG